MEKLTNFLEKYLVPLAEVFSNNRYIKAIKETFLLILPFTIFGSFFVAIVNIPFLSKFIDEGTLGAMKTFISPTFTFTMQIMALLVAPGVGYSLSNHYKVKPLFGAMLGIISYLMIIPSSLKVEGGKVIANVLSIGDLGAYGMFSAILIAIFSTEIYRWAIQKNITIKMPDSVPPVVADSFFAFVPIVITLFAVLLVKNAFLHTSFDNLNHFIYVMLQKPLVSLGTSLPAMIIVGILVNLFWFFGLHGHIIVLSIMFPIFNAKSIESLEAFKAGKELPYIINGQFSDFFVVNGGFVSIPVIICLLFLLRKDETFSELGKVAAVPAIFGVYEPLIFGLPIMLNPILFIPFMITPVITTVVSYFAMSSGLVAYTTGVFLPYTMPLGISGVLSTNSISGAILQIFLVVILTLMWYVFLRILSHSRQQELQAQQTQATQ